MTKGSHVKLECEIDELKSASALLYLTAEHVLSHPREEAGFKKFLLNQDQLDALWSAIGHVRGLAVKLHTQLHDADDAEAAP